MATSNSKYNAIVVVDSASAETESLPYTPLLTAEQQEQDTVPGAVDYKHRPAIRSKHGRWISASFFIWVEMAERMAYFGISGNLISYLTGELGQPTAMAASNINAWSGVSKLLPILGAVIADSFMGKYYTIVASSCIYILGLGLMALSAMLSSLSCLNNSQIIIFFVGLYLVAIGQGGHKPCLQAFGADQFDEEDPTERKAKSSFFNWWYFGVCLGGLLGIGVLSYVQDNLSWALGFGIPCILLVIALVILLLGTMTYRYPVKLEGESPFTRIGRVFVAAANNWNAKLPVDGDGDGDAKPHDGSVQLTFLNKALIAPDTVKRCVKACSKSEVEEAKAVLKLFPTWATNLVFAIVYSQTTTFFLKQGITLDRSITSNFAIPAAAMMSFSGICIIVFLPIYDRVLVPIARKSTGKPAGISMLQRIGIGQFISIIAMVIAAVIEKRRLETASEHGLMDLPNVTIPMSIWWLLPQYALMGISEAFTMVGLQEYFYDQVPNELRSVGLSLYLSILGLGGLLSSFLVSLINKVTRFRGGGESWFSNNLNHAHLDYFYWLLAALSVLQLAFFVYFAKSYIYNKNKASS
ncbi:hypothetical protein SOVF_203300 [Spinacia oleracea]|uniref:Protein NRT1/ PTR FAMILY 5.10-like n=1 Tax=Spinacia oleracea TaxID=3562 RepID=A0A9R0IEM3_SPIOL|nr:protein NRT1/ PTR FAMILY 5.10-like [Spinacia oleracea]XP_056693381.1 protein NRT1/ PTR FAMILY 5.10-like [Spinacia oleracea]KNA04047.1 hypothetical protein SOVF_203300 [Spinacia oleracea]